MLLFFAFVTPIIGLVIYYLISSSNKKSINDDAVNRIVEKEQDQSPLVVIYSTNQLMEAHFLSSKLGSEGIENALQDENMATMYSMTANIFGGVKIVVGKHDEARARQIIEEHQNARPVNEDGTELKCPQCGSDELHINEQYHLGSGGPLAGVTLGTLMKNKEASCEYKCKVCGHEFEQEL